MMGVMDTELKKRKKRRKFLTELQSTEVCKMQSQEKMQECKKG